MIKSYRNYKPSLHETVRVAENAVVIGNVQAAENVSIWYGSTVRGDAGSISIGRGTNIQDGCVFHNADGIPLTVGENVVVGHGAILHSCTVEDGCLIGMGAILLNNCVIGKGSVVAAGALVPEHKVIPPGSMVMGVPAKVVRTLTDEEQKTNIDAAAGYVEHAAEELPLASEQ